MASRPRPLSAATDTRSRCRSGTRPSARTSRAFPATPRTTAPPSRKRHWRRAQVPAPSCRRAGILRARRPCRRSQRGQRGAWLEPDYTSRRMAELPRTGEVATRRARLRIALGALGVSFALATRVVRLRDRAPAVPEATSSPSASAPSLSAFLALAEAPATSALGSAAPPSPSSPDDDAPPLGPEGPALGELTPSPRLKARPARRPAPSDRSTPSCDPPFRLDPQGHKHFKAGCAPHGVGEQDSRPSNPGR